MELGVYMLPSDMKLNIRSGTVGYSNKILVSDSGFSLGKNDMVNTTVPEKSSNKTTIMHAPKKLSYMTPSMYSPKAVHNSVNIHEEERVALVLVLASTFGIWYAFR